MNTQIKFSVITLSLISSAFLFVGCGDSGQTGNTPSAPPPTKSGDSGQTDETLKNSPSAKKGLFLKNQAKIATQQDVLFARASTLAPDAVLDPDLEAKAKEIEDDFAAAQKAVDESRANGGSGSCTKSRNVSGSMKNEQLSATLTETYQVTLPIGSQWSAVVEKTNGAVTKAEKFDNP